MLDLLSVGLLVKLVSLSVGGPWCADHQPRKCISTALGRINNGNIDNSSICGQMIGWKQNVSVVKWTAEKTCQGLDGRREGK